MPITLDLIATGLVTSSLFLMAISIPRIIIVLTLSRLRFFYLSRIEKTDDMLHDIPALKRWIPQGAVQAWREPKQMANSIAEELKKLIDLGKAFVESIMAAVFLTVAGLYLGADGGAGLIIMLLIIFLIASVVLGGITTIRYVARLTSICNNLYSDRVKPQIAQSEPQAPSS